MREDSKLEVCRGNGVKWYSKHKLLPAEANVSNLYVYHFCADQICVCVSAQLRQAS